MADVKVNKGQWDAVSSADQKAIIDGLCKTGALQSGDRIVPDPNVAPFDENTQMKPMSNPIKDTCKALCDSAAQAGFAWCIANTTGPVLAACIAAVEAARDLCRDRC
jgi:hypothetical protein